MNKKHFHIVVWFIGALLVSGCIGSKLGYARKGERVIMTAPPKRDVINYSLLKKQQEKPQTFASRGDVTRGAATAFTGSLVSLGVAAVKSVIANEHKKYTAEWKQGLNDLYFYDQPSAEGPFDPTGMQFNGFTITRTFRDKNQQVHTAVTAEFEVDKDSVPNNEIINDAIFRLKLKNIKVNYAKAKVPLGKDTLNIDFNIVFLTSYISPDGRMYKDVELGRFYLGLRKVPLDSAAAGYNEYYAKLKNKKLDGRAFIVPRSFGHYKTAPDSVISLYNQGMFSIAVEVKECSKNLFVNELLLNTSSIAIDYSQSVLMKEIQSKLGNK